MTESGVPLDASSAGNIVLVGRETFSTRVVASALAARFRHVTIILEDAPSLHSQVRSRIRRFGFRRGMGQLLFRAFSPLLSIPQRARMAALAALAAGMGGGHDALLRNAISVDSVNSARARRVLKELQPDVVVVNGTRIVGSKTLGCARIFINMHAGITPGYRGVHGGYWAMVSGDAGNFGVTVHRVDRGVDTGEIIFQERTQPAAGDGFFTYPMIQLKLGLPLLVRAVENALENRLVYARPAGQDMAVSRQWYHPTLLEYIGNGLSKGVW